MKASIKLIKSYGSNENGYPVFKELVHLKRRRREIIFRCPLEFWNYDKKEPDRKFSDFNEVYSLLLNVRYAVSKINNGYFTFEEAEKILFNTEKIEPKTFFQLGMKLIKPGKNGQLYKTVLNSFNSHFPQIYINEIEKRHAIKYMNILLASNTPNGVHTYMRTLTAIFNKISVKENPFTGVRPKKVKTGNKALTVDDITKLVLTRTIPNKFDGHNTIETINYPRYYWMLMFYLGGIDFIDLANLRYDKHVVNDRIQFNRNKGGTSVFINNKILPEAFEILSKFDNSDPYLVPIHKYQDYHSYLNKVNKTLSLTTKDLSLTKKPLTKSARYSFITRAQQLLIDERITMEIVGHAQQKTHSIYTDEFPLSVRDEAHKKIVGCVKPMTVTKDSIFKTEKGRNLFFYCLDRITFDQNRQNIGAFYHYFLPNLICKKYEFADFWNSLDQPFKISKYGDNLVGLDALPNKNVYNELDTLRTAYHSI